MATIRDVRSVTFSTAARSMLVVVVETDEGLIGLGEAGIRRAPPGHHRGDRDLQDLADRPGCHPDRASLAIPLPGRLLPRRQHPQRRPSRRSTSPSGTSTPRRSACRSTGCSAGRCATACRPTATSAGTNWRGVVESAQARPWRRAGASSAGASRSRATATSRRVVDPREHRRHGGAARRRWATRSRSASTSTPASTRPTPSRSSRGIEATRPYFIEDPVRSRECAALPPPARAHPQPAGGGRALRLEVGIAPVDRGGPDRLRARRPLHRRRHHRGAQARRLVRDPPDPPGDAQPARADLARRPACT